VHVVNQHGDRLARQHPGEERQPVLDVDDGVDAAEATAGQREHPPEVHPHLRTATYEPDPVVDLVGGSGRMSCAEDGDASAAVDETPGHLLEVDLGPAALRVAGVAPAEEDDVASVERSVGHRRKGIGWLG
jgi:hypothetical protein